MTFDHIYDTTSLDNAVAYKLHRTARLLRYSLNCFLQKHQLGISVEQWFLLFRLYERDGQSQGELADKDLNDHPNITRLIDALARRGLVRRQTDPQDRRRSLVFLTEQGQKFMSDTFPLVIEERKRIFNGLSEAEIDQLLHVLTRLEANARK